MDMRDEPKAFLDLAKYIRVLRSKNAGPFLITFDVVFRRPDDLKLVRSAISPTLVSRHYSIPEAAVVGIEYLEQLLAMKISIRRGVPAGHPGDSDCYGMNQEQPLRHLLQEIFAE
jgi:hypothetical protein